MESEENINSEKTEEIRVVDFNQGAFQKFDTVCLKFGLVSVCAS